MGFPAGSVGEESAFNALDTGDTGLIPGSGRSPGERNVYPLQYSCLENSMDRGAWQAIVQGLAKSQTWLKDFHLLTHSYIYMCVYTYTHMYIMECYWIVQNDGILPFLATWVDLENIILGEVRTKTNIIWYHLYVQNKIWYKWTDLQHRNILTDIENKLTVIKVDSGGGMGREIS